MSTILILEVDGYHINYDPILQRFYVVDKDETELTWKDTQKECQDYIDKDKKKKRAFEPISAIYPTDRQVVKITSQDANDPNEVWIVSNKRGRFSDSGRSKVRLGYLGYRGNIEYHLYKNNLHNNDILTAILEQEKLIEQSRKQIETLNLQFTDPITQENLKEQPHGND